MIHFEGGGWPYDIDQAFLRSKTDLGSSKKYPRCMKSSNMKFTLSNQQARNPMMFDWNIVYVKYCDGGSYAGDATVNYKGKPLYFKGKAIREALIRQLLINEGMQTASDVVISGCSAGGLAIYFGIDAMSAIINQVNGTTKVYGLSDSGFFGRHPKVKNFQIRKFGDRENAVVESHLDYAGAMSHIYGLMNLSAGVHSDCVNEQRRAQLPEDHCVFAEFNARYIRTPLFALQPKFDRWQLWHILGQPFDVALVNSFGDSVYRSVLGSLLTKPQHGAFFDACAHHWLVSFLSYVSLTFN